MTLNEQVSSQCIFKVKYGVFMGRFRFKAGFYDIIGMPNEFQNKMANTLQVISRVLCFLDKILSNTRVSMIDRNILVENVFLVALFSNRFESLLPETTKKLMQH